MTPDDLNNLIQAVIRAQQYAQNPTGNEKDLKFAEPIAFTGKPEDLDPMIREAEVRFSVLQRTYNTPTKRAFYILSLFKSGNARLWKEQYLRQREGKTLCEGDSWT